ncbi:DNA internalization-related competence protein ComEC/Rec2 [Mycoplasmatota bacterium WC44]
MRQLKISYLSNNIIFIAFSVLATLISLSNYYFIIPAFLYFKWLKKHKIFEVSFYISLVVGSLFIYNNNYLPEIKRDCLVVESDESKSICKGNRKYIVYESYKVGDLLNINGDFNLPNYASSPYTFNYKSYLKSKGIYYLVYKPDATFIENKGTIYDFREYVKNYLNTFPTKNKSYLSALIIGDKSLINDEIVNSMVDVGIIHLFAISGLHVGLICIILRRIFGLFLNETDSDNILIVFLIFYMLLAGFSVSVVRASLMFSLSIMNKKLRLPLSNLDILSITFLIFICINPLSILDIGFQLSFIVTLFLILGFKIVKGDLLKQSLYVSLLAQLATLPIVVNLNNQINILSVIYNIFFVLLMTYILLPVTFTTFFMKMFNDLYFEVIILFERLVLIFDDLSILIKVPNIHIILVVVYYGLLFIFLSNLENNIIHKNFYLVVLIFFIPYINPIDSVYFIDVEQGDSTLFKSRFNICNVLVDTGGKIDRKITTNNVVPFLNSIGTSKIDYFVLTHSHFDHVGGAIDIIDNYTVKNLVVSKYNTGELINNISLYARSKGINIIDVKPGDYIGCNNEFKVLGPNKRYQSINNQSIVLDIDFGGKEWLLMGDSELKDFNTRNIDVLMVGHHGSNTSLDEELLRKLSPRTSVISSGKNNYGLPSPQIVELIMNSNIKLHRTDIDNTVHYLNIANGIFLNTSSYNSIVLGKPKYI